MTTVWTKIGRNATATAPTIVVTRTSQGVVGSAFSEALAASGATLTTTLQSPKFFTASKSDAVVAVNVGTPTITPPTGTAWG